MPKFLKLLRDQSGVIHLIPLFLILIGIVAGVYLVQHPQIFKPKASSNIIEWQVGGSDNCITSVNPDNNKYATATCSKLKLKFNLPAQSSDAGPNISLVKTAYAAEPEGEFCNPAEPNKVFHNEIQTGNTLKYTGICAVPGAVIGGILGGVFGFGFGAIPMAAFGAGITSGVCGVIGASVPAVQEFTDINKPVGVDCPTGAVCQSDGNKATCVQDIYKALPDIDERTRMWLCQDNKIMRRYVDQNNEIQDIEEKDCSNYSDGCENYYNQDKAIQDARCAGSIESAPNPYTTNENTVRWFCKDEKIWREFIPDPSKPYKTSTIQDSRDCEAEDLKCEEYYNTDEKKNDATCVVKVDTSPTPTLTAQPSGKPAGVIPPGAVGVPQVPSSQTITTCKGQENYQDVLNRTRQAGYPGPFDQASVIAAYNRAACPSAATTAPTTAPTISRKIVKYRYQVSYPPTKQSGWINITGGDISIDTENASSGTQMIIFEFADSNEQIVEVEGKSSVTAYVTFVAPGTPAVPTTAPEVTQAPTANPTQLDADLLVNQQVAYPKIQFKVFRANKNWTLFYQETPGARCGGTCAIGPSGGWTAFSPSLPGVVEGAGSGGVGDEAVLYWTPPSYVSGVHTIALIDLENSRIVRQVDVTFQDNTPAGSIAAGSECSAYATTSVCGGSSQTYDKCIDEKGQSGSSLCSNGATKFYCVGSTNSNCDSRYDGTQKKVVEGTFQYSCAQCPNLINRNGDSGD